MPRYGAKFLRSLALFWRFLTCDARFFRFPFRARRPFYKNIDDVIAAQQDLVAVIGKFTPRIVRMADEAGEF